MQIEITDELVERLAKAWMENNPVHGRRLRWRWWPIASADIRPAYLRCARENLTAAISGKEE